MIQGYAMKVPRYGFVHYAAAALLAAFTLSALGCGPVQSTMRVSEAEVALERARVAEADQKSPYEYYSAKFYLHKSKEEWGYSDFEASLDYATEARRAAEAALLKAKEDPWNGSPADPEITREAMIDKGVYEANPAAGVSGSKGGDQ